MKNNNGIIFGLLAVAGALYLYKSKSRKDDSPQPEPTPAPPTNNTTPAPYVPPAAPVYNYPIVYGSFHPDAKLIQQALGVTQDGVIGPKTVAAWQKKVPGITSKFSIPNRTALNNAVYEIKGQQPPSPPITSLPRPQMLLAYARQGKDLVFINKSIAAVGFLDATGAFQKQSEATYTAGTVIASKDIVAAGKSNVFFNRNGKTVMANANSLTAK